MFLEYLLYYVSDTISSISQYAYKVGFMICFADEETEATDTFNRARITPMVLPP